MHPAPTLVLPISCFTPPPTGRPYPCLHPASSPPLHSAPLPPLPPPLLQFLCNGLEEDMALRRAMAQSTSDERELMERASGKMVLLAKLLPKLRAEGRR